MPHYAGHSEKARTAPELTGFTVLMEYNSSNRKKAESTYKNMSHNKDLPSSYFAPDRDQMWRSRKSRRTDQVHTILPMSFLPALNHRCHSSHVSKYSDYCAKRTKVNSKSQNPKINKLKFNLVNIYIDSQKHFHILHQSLWKTLIQSINSGFSEQKCIAVIVDIGM